MGFVKKNGRWTYHREPGQKKISEMTDEECIRFVNSHHLKNSSITPRELLKLVEEGKCTLNTGGDSFEQWKKDVLAGKYDRKER